jgi:hypothetical protein
MRRRNSSKSNVIRKHVTYMQQNGKKVTRLTLGDLFSCFMQVSFREDANGKQKSAEAVVAEVFFCEGLNVRSESKPQ